MRFRLLNLLTILTIFVFIGIFDANALSKEDIIKKAYQDMLDRDPESYEFTRHNLNFSGYDIIKRDLNASKERSEAITQIYQGALKRNPRSDEIEALKRFGAPNNLIRKSLYESPERKLAIIDAYKHLVDKEPRQDELDFYVNTRSPFSKIKGFLNETPERNEAIEKYFNLKLSRKPSSMETKYFIDNLVSIHKIGTDQLQPVAKATDSNASPEIRIFTLDANESYDLSGYPLTYSWEVIDSPISSLPEIMNPGSKVEIKFPEDPLFKGYSNPGSYKFKLLVNNGRMDSNPLIITIKIQEYTQYEEYLNELLNGLRESEGEEGAVSLKLNLKLTRSSRKYSKYMLDNMWFSHGSKEGGRVDGRVLAENYDFQHVGENLGVIKTNDREMELSKDLVDSLFESWKKSPSHYKNMINQKFDEVGIGFEIGEVSDPNNPIHLYATIHFGKEFQN